MEELYRVVLQASEASSSSSSSASVSAAAAGTGPPNALLPLRDLCNDTLRVVTAVPGYHASPSLLSSLPSSDDDIAGPGAAAAAVDSAAVDPAASVAVEDGYASFPPHSPTNEGDTATEHHERSPLKAGGRRDSSASSGSAGRKRSLTSSTMAAPTQPSSSPPSRYTSVPLLKRFSLFSSPAAAAEPSTASLPLPPSLTGGPTDAPLVDIGAVFGSDAVPEGFTRVATTPYGRKADLNSGAGGHYIYLILKKDRLTRRRPPVVGLTIIFPDRKEFVPPTFSVVRRRGEPVDFNAGTHGERVYLCFKRGAGNPITDIQVVFPRKKEGVPLGYTLVERTPFNYEADLNAGGARRGGAGSVSVGGGNNTIFICYKQRLRNVDHLRSAPAAPAAVGTAAAAAPAAVGDEKGGGGGGGLGGSSARSSSYETILTRGPVVGLPGVEGREGGGRAAVAAAVGRRMRRLCLLLVLRRRLWHWIVTNRTTAAVGRAGRRATTAAAAATVAATAAAAGGSVKGEEGGMMMPVLSFRVGP